MGEEITLLCLRSRFHWYGMRRDVVAGLLMFVLFGTLFGTRHSKTSRALSTTCQHRVQFSVGVSGDGPDSELASHQARKSSPTWSRRVIHKVGRSISTAGHVG